MRLLSIFFEPAPEDEILARITLPPFVDRAIKAIVVASFVLSLASISTADGDYKLFNLTFALLTFVPWLLWIVGLLRSRRLLAALVLAPPAAVGVIALAGILAEDSTGLFVNLTIVMWVFFALAPRRELAQIGVASYLVFLWLGVASGEIIDGTVWLVVLTFTLLALMGIRAGAMQIARAQQRLAQAQAADARRQIARDVHDVVAHTLAVTMLHLTAARMAVHRGASEDATVALDEAERQGLASLTDVRRVLQVLDAEQELAPLDLGGIPALVDKYRRAGLPVVLAVGGPVDSLTPAAGVTVYRVVQEALANAARHGRGSATVELQVTDDAVELVVTNPRQSGDEPRPAGNGIRGMHERVDAVGGRITVGGAGAEWRVHARLPTGHVVRPDVQESTEARTDDPSVVGR